MTRDPRLYLDEILESINQIETYTADLTAEQFQSNLLIQDAVARRLEIIGEAVKHLPAEITDRHPDVPWKRVAGMRDVLIHGYFGVDMELTWTVVKSSLPDLRTSIGAIIEEMAS
jgi:uncharacterized protein with HEPN domain